MRHPVNYSPKDVRDFKSEFCKEVKRWIKLKAWHEEKKRHIKHKIRIPHKFNEKTGLVTYKASDVFKAMGKEKVEYFRKKKYALIKKYGLGKYGLNKKTHKPIEIWYNCNCGKHVILVAKQV